MKRALIALLTVLALVPTACASAGRGRTQEYCTVDKRMFMITVCVESTPNKAEIHIQTQVKGRKSGKGVFLSEPDVNRRTPYTALIDYSARVSEKPEGVEMVVRATPNSPNIKSVTCKIYDGGVLMTERTARNTYNDPRPVCFYESPVPPPRK